MRNRFEDRTYEINNHRFTIIKLDHRSAEIIWNTYEDKKFYIDVDATNDITFEATDYQWEIVLTNPSSIFLDRTTLAYERNMTMEKLDKHIDNAIRIIEKKF